MSAIAGNPSSEDQSDFSEGTNAWLTSHLDYIRELIVKEAENIAAKRDQANTAQGKVVIHPMDIAEAARHYAPGDRIPPLTPPKPPKEETWWNRITYSISGVTIISALLAVIFGVIGFLIARPENAAPWLDIAKIFAGAVVGSAGAVATTTVLASR